MPLMTVTLLIYNYHAASNDNADHNYNAAYDYDAACNYNAAYDYMLHITVMLLTSSRAASSWLALYGAHAL